MGKFADRYFEIHPWQVIEEGFDPAHSEVSESVFSLGNEYTGLRGYFDEGYSGASLQGCYLNGVYESRDLPPIGYKGMLSFTEFMVNTVDWVYTRINCNGQFLDLSKVRFSDFRRVLDLRSGLMTREFIWHVDDTTSVKLIFERFTSMEEEQYCGQKITINVLSGKADIAIRAGLDFSRPHMFMKKPMFHVYFQKADGAGCEIQATTQKTNQTVYAAASFKGMKGKELPDDGAVVSNLFSARLSAGETVSLERVVTLVCARNAKEFKTLEARERANKEHLSECDFETMKRASAKWWENQWKVSDIEIEGDEVNQQGIRFCIFQLHQTLHTAKYGAVFGAKGLTGEAYNGNTFWDSEAYCLPFYLFNNPKAAKSILQFRYDTLSEAKKRAEALDCKGAFYPIATISGRECCDLWQHASLQLQASTGVAYGLWNYVHLTGDKEYLYKEGIEMLAEISRMLASRGNFDAITGKYGYYCVMGPDEFQMMVNHNAYTNFMGKKTLQFTLDTLAEMKESAPEALNAVTALLGLTDEELKDWADKADKMYIPYSDETKLFEQHDGFFHLPHLDVSAIPVEDFPLYSHWSYERIYRNDMLKQPDVLMFMMLYGSEFTKEQLAVNFDYYEPRCIHESSLSPSIHSILACRLDRVEKAEDYFGFATRMDLDDYNRNTREGLHTTSIAGAWMNIIYGFGGLNSDGDELSLSPCIPQTWKKYTFSLRTKDSVLAVEVEQEKLTICCKEGEPVNLKLYDQDITVTNEPVSYALKGKE
ncbi:MAG: family 65 glycosyl hydrolase [Lachnospiraceae bacterium]|nr:family 65 glycosyl hydrolase [Lachnospiraceae bacterium]